MRRLWPARIGTASVCLIQTLALLPPTRARSEAAASSATVRGVVRARGTRTAMPDAAIEGPSGAPLVTTGAEGSFELSLPPGQHTLRVSAAGYQAETFTERLDQHHVLEVIYRLQPLTTASAYETTVRGERPRTELSRVTLRGRELSEVPGTMGDPFRAVTLLPGVGSVGSGVGQPIVRGTPPAATGYFLDGVRVPTLFHAVIGPAVVHPEFIETIEFSPSLAPVRYEGLLGGVVDCKVSRPRESRTRATAYLDLINAGAFVEHPVRATGTSLTLAGRISYTPLLLALTQRAFARPGDPKLRAEFYDYQGRLEQRTGPGSLRLLGFGASDAFASRATDAESISGGFATSFHRLDLRYRGPTAAGTLELGVTAGDEGTALKMQSGEQIEHALALRQRSLAARVGLQRDVSDGLRLSVGVDLQRTIASTTFVRPLDPSRVDPGQAAVFEFPTLHGLRASGFGELVWLPATGWTVAPAVRLQNHHLWPAMDRAGIDPQLTVRHELRERLTLKLGVALVHQPPTVLLQLPVADLAGLRHGLQLGGQLGAGVEWRPTDSLELTADVYYHPLLRAIELDLDSLLSSRRQAGFTPSDVATAGYGYGLELLARHALGRGWFGWISYAYQRSERRERFLRFDPAGEVLGAAESYLPFAFEQRHVANLVVSRSLPAGFSAGAVLHFNTGRPESGELSSRTRQPGRTPDGAEERWAPVDRDQLDRLPAFFRADLRVSKRWLLSDATVELYLDVLNASLQPETYGYSYLTRPIMDASRPGASPTGRELRKTPLQLRLVLPMLGVKGTY